MQVPIFRIVLMLVSTASFAPNRPPAWACLLIEKRFLFLRIALTGGPEIAWK
jgi:hypothetical protein